jgi:L-fuconolactonase
VRIRIQTSSAVVSPVPGRVRATKACYGIPRVGGELPTDQRVVDAQLHVWPAASAEHPWQPSPRTPFRESFSCADALLLMEQAGVGAALLIPPIWNRFDDGYARACATAHPRSFAVVSWFDPSAPDLAARLAETTAPEEVVGIRLILTVPPGSGWLRDGRLEGGALDALWPAAEAGGVPLVVRLTRTVGELAAVAAGHPALAIVVDHCAAESEPDDSAFAALPSLLGLARYENVYVKLSSLSKYSREPSPYPDMDVVVERVVDAFGADRCMWGSDITQYWDSCAYPDVVDHFRSGCLFRLDA